MSLYTQIPTIVNDAVSDMLGTGDLTSALDTSDLVSLGESLESSDLYELFYGKLVNRIVGTMYAARAYESKKRGILRDERAWGAFKQKVHYTMPEAVENPALAIPTISDSTRTYTQASPYDVTDVISVNTIIFAGQGTWSIEFIRPIAQIMSAFTSTSEMMAFIDGLYMTAENAYKVEEEAVENMAAATAIAEVIQNGYSVNLLTEYNATLDSGSTALTVDTCMTSVEFLRYAAKRINDVLGYMGKMSTLFNPGATQKFTSKSRAVVEILHDFASASETYLQSDTYHNELVKLPMYNDIAYWQGSGTSFDFDDVSTINIQNDAFVTDDNTTGTITQSGIIAFIHDIDAVAAFFGERYSWEQENKRSRIMIHGEQARKGYGVDPNENMVVFYVANS